jgi:hypothetical protein
MLFDTKGFEKSFSPNVGEIGPRLALALPTNIRLAQTILVSEKYYGVEKKF